MVKVQVNKGERVVRVEHAGRTHLGKYDRNHVVSDCTGDPYLLRAALAASGTLGTRFTADWDRLYKNGGGWIPPTPPSYDHLFPREA